MKNSENVERIFEMTFFNIDNPAEWHNFGKTEKTGFNNNTITVENKENLVNIVFPEDTEFLAKPEFIDGKNIRAINVAKVKHENNEDGTRTTTETWQILFDAPDRTTFSTKREFPKYHPPFSTINCTINCTITKR